jgi:hypothetical protein
MKKSRAMIGGDEVTDGVSEQELKETKGKVKQASD